MGFSVSGSAVIVFIGLVVAAGIAVPPLMGSVGNLASAQGTQIDQGTERLNTDVEIAAATYDDDAEELDIELENTGTTSLSVADTDLLVDGAMQTDADNLATTVEGDADAELWLPAETLTMTVGATTEPDRVKVVTENGIERATNDITDGET
ncbi:fla cluster protein FlaF [Natronomonas pharaonis DSM 2160]|uniref:Fla cluster protein FlaF n=1 Tax=Natronomonas pharaonis (strain ATCC 35678 / DSM 2160 / CIP 103997 / JCM 8858 / NBRC 14720 / NCIMB 2260 / Gabara) TaxID=348780 RepID=A0A1U7EVQ1_NATPD|nr:fla cluster protein FlaF [Natronomonas pharaonis]CAI49138.1 fla cluster protein FlaF [Natronomonas pharaonis DSM 2160]